MNWIGDISKWDKRILNPFSHLSHEDAAERPALKQSVITDTEPLGTFPFPSQPPGSEEIQLKFINSPTSAILLQPHNKIGGKR